MPFEHVKMGPVEEAFNAYTKAKGKADLAAKAVKELAHYGDGKTEAKPSIQVDAGLLRYQTRLGDSKAWDVIGEALAGTIKQDFAANVRSVALILAEEAEKLRVEFLRLTMNSIAGETPPAS